MDSKKEKLTTEERVIQLLEEILKWQKFQAIDKLRTIILEKLKKDDEKLVYNSSDGKSMREISKLCGVPFQTIDSWWKKWNQLGIMRLSQKYTGRMQRLCSLDEVGIKVSQVKSKRKQVITEHEGTETETGGSSQDLASTD